MRWLLAVVVVAHGLIHFLGLAKGFGLAQLPQLTQPVPRSLGILWGIAGLAVVSAGVLLAMAPRSWWVVGFGAAVLSQAVIVTAWTDARFGTLPNLLLLLAATYGFAAEGPLSLRAEYRREVAARLEGVGSAAMLVESDLVSLPEPVQRLLRVTGAVGRSRPRLLRARFRGRIRGSPEDPWMSFTAEQYSFLDEPARFFLMDARRAGLPVDVLHAFRDGAASMRVRLLSAVPLVDASGPEATRAETVTLLNDLCLFATGGLVDPAIRWEPMNERSARAHYTLGPHTVSAVLHFDDAGELVDFVSDDRLAASPDGSEFVRQRWSTPVGEYRSYDSVRAPSRGRGLWHPPDGGFAYMELEVLDLEIDPDPDGDHDRKRR